MYRDSASSIAPSRSAASNSATSVATSSRAVCPCSSIGRPQETLCRRNSVLRRLAKASFCVCSGQNIVASSARPTQPRFRAR